MKIDTRGRLLSSSPLGAATSCSKNRFFPWGGIGASINSCAAYLQLAALLRSGAGAQLTLALLLDGLAAICVAFAAQLLFARTRRGLIR